MMSTQVHFVRNNPFVLNDSRLGQFSRQKESNFDGNRNYTKVSQSASCSNLQQRPVNFIKSETDFQPPVPVSVLRRFRAVSEHHPPEKSKVSRHSEPRSHSVHSVAYYAKESESSKDDSRQDTHQFGTGHGSGPYFGVLEHSQSHGAISRAVQSDFQEPLKIDLTETKMVYREKERQENWQKQRQTSPETNHMEYGPGIVQKLREKFSKLASTAVESAQISPHARQKRFPSVDDILSESEKPYEKKKLFDPNHNEKMPNIPQQPVSQQIRRFAEPEPLKHELPPAQSVLSNVPPPKPVPTLPEIPIKSSKPIVAEAEEPRAVVEAAPIAPISALRAKFEHQANHGSAGFSRINYGNRSKSASAVVRKSASNDNVLDQVSEEVPSFKPPVPVVKPVLEHSFTIHAESIKASSSVYQNDSQSAPKPVRVMDLVSPPADPAPKEYLDRYQSQMSEILPSPTSSIASSDRSPPPEEPRLRPDETHQFNNTAQFIDSKSVQMNRDFESNNNFRTQTIRDERSNERQYFDAQKHKMTLTLPIGENLPLPAQPVPQKMPSDVKIGKPGSTPITGPSKLKIPNDDSGISEVQKLLDRFNVMREQKMQDSLQIDAVKEVLTEEKQSLPTAIVPPVQHTTPITQPILTHWKDQQKNIVNITIGQTEADQDETSDYSQRRIVTNLPPPPLPPRGGTEQQQLQRKSLTSRWLESKESSSSTSSVETDDGSIDRKENIDEKELQKPLSAFGYPKPYGDNEIIEEQTRRSLETMSVVAEETEEDMEEEGAVKFIGQRPINEVWKSDDSGVVHRSDFLKSSTAYDSSESDEDDSPHAHLAAMYGIHRIGFYEPPAASDGNPVRHSLLNLVAEEDIPELLQAMAEEHHFVFDDCTEMPTTSGIIHTPAKRLERKKQRNVDRICFVEKPPEVFAYLDEDTANEEGEWSSGVPITYDEYKTIVEASQQEQAQQHLELAKFRMVMDQKYAQSLEVETQRSPDPDSAVTSTFSYGEKNPTSCGSPLQFKQTDMGTSAI